MNSLTKDLTATESTRTGLAFANVLDSPRDLLALTKPSITAMSVIVAAGGMVIAPGEKSLPFALLSLLGIALSVMGAGALNMFIERDLDALMSRTQNRPLPGRRMEPWVALLVGLLLAGASLPLLFIVANPLTCALTAFALFSYVLVYTPLKQVSWWALPVGAIPGALPTLMGYTAITGKVDGVGLVLFGVLFLWQLPHFAAISIYREKEYSRAGYVVLPAVYGVDAAKIFIVATSVALSVVALLLWPLGVASLIYVIPVALLSLWFVWLSVRGFFADCSPTWARRVFFGSLVYQTVLFGALAIDVGVQTML